METNQNTEFIQSVNDFLHSKQQEIEASEGKKGIVVIAIEDAGEHHNACVSIMGQGEIIVEGLTEFLEGQANGSKLLAHAAKRAMLKKMIKGLGGGECDCENCRNESEHPVNQEQKTSNDSEEQTA